MIVSVLSLLLATAISVGVVETVIESARTDAVTIAVFDRVLLEPGVPAGIWILCGMSAVAALALVAAGASIRGRRLERRLAAELDARYGDMSSMAAGDAARAHLLEARVAELQTWIERATEERDEARAALAEAQHETAAAERRAREAAGARPVVVVPEAPTEVVTEPSSA
ncbi:MAG: hypothetical protein WD096_11005 [Actinomycetota bacterium]